MARLPALDKYSYADLIALRDEVDSAISLRKNEEKAALRQQLADIAKSQGFDLDEVMGRRRAKGPVAVKYRDPDDAANTWTGRGRQPRWLAAALKKRGVKIEDFLV